MNPAHWSVADQAAGERQGAQVLHEGGEVSGGAELGGEAVRSDPGRPGRERLRLGSQGRVRVSGVTGSRGRLCFLYPGRFMLLQGVSPLLCSARRPTVGLKVDVIKNVL